MNIAIFVNTYNNTFSAAFPEARELSSSAAVETSVELWNDEESLTSLTLEKSDHHQDWAS